MWWAVSQGDFNFDFWEIREQQGNTSVDSKMFCSFAILKILISRKELYFYISTCMFSIVVSKVYIQLKFLLITEFFVLFEMGLFILHFNILERECYFLWVKGTHFAFCNKSTMYTLRKGPFRFFRIFWKTNLDFSFCLRRELNIQLLQDLLWYLNKWISFSHFKRNTFFQSREIWYGP